MVTKKEVREQLRAQRQAERDRRRLEKEAAINACRLAIQRPIPSQYQEWGSVRSGAYIKALGGVVRLVRRFDGGAKIGCAKFTDALVALNDAMTMPIDLLVKKLDANKLEKGMT